MKLPKLLLFIVLICISLEYVSLQRISNYRIEVKNRTIEEVKNKTIEEQIHELQNQVKFVYKYFKLAQFIPKEGSKEGSKESPKERFLKSLSKQEKESLLCFKEIYLSKRGQIENYRENRTWTRSEGRDEIKERFTNFSSQLIEDLLDCAFNISTDKGLINTVSDMLYQLELWGVRRFILNATYVEQKMNDFANEMGQENYAFLREDYTECVKLFETDLSQKVAPDTVSRIISLFRMIYGDCTQVETALAYLYGGSLNATQEIQKKVIGVD